MAYLQDEKVKKIHVKPSFYAYNFEPLKKIAFQYGYNLVMHGSLARDFDLIAIPWFAVRHPKETAESRIKDGIPPYNTIASDMILEMCEYMGGSIMKEDEESHKQFRETHYGRDVYVIQLNRSIIEGTMPYEYHQYYLDISIIPAH